jgi:hypothetical protein
MELQTTTKLVRQKDGVDFEICLRMNKSGLGPPDVDVDKYLTMTAALSIVMDAGETITL